MIKQGRFMGRYFKYACPFCGHKQMISKMVWDNGINGRCCHCRRYFGTDHVQSKAYQLKEIEE